MQNINKVQVVDWRLTGNKSKVCFPLSALFSRLHTFTQAILQMQPKYFPIGSWITAKQDDKLGIHTM